MLAKPVRPSSLLVDSVAVIVACSRGVLCCLVTLHVCVALCPVNGTGISNPAFYGFTDGTTVWCAAVSDRTVEPFIADYKDPFGIATGSSLNPFGNHDAIDSDPYVMVRSAA